MYQGERYLLDKRPVTFDGTTYLRVNPHHEDVFRVDNMQQMENWPKKKVHVFLDNKDRKWGVCEEDEGVIGEI